MQYCFKSGKYIREKQIKDEILGYYGIQVTHINYYKVKTNEIRITR